MNYQLQKLTCDALRAKIKAPNLGLSEKLNKATTLTEKFLILRDAVNAQSAGKKVEAMIMKDLNIGPPLDKTSGDGNKNNINYEMKFSLHDKDGKFNFVQIRPDHKIDFYIVGGYNIWEGEIGKAYICKVPSEELYKLIPEYGGYAHGTVEEYGEITCDNIKGRNCEFALRPNPNGKEGTKPKKLWNEIKKYEVDYLPENF